MKILFSNFIVYFILAAMFVFSLTILPIYLVTKILGLEYYFVKFYYFIMQRAVKLVLKVLNINVVIEGEVLPKDLPKRPLLLIANHLAAFDAVIIGTFFRAPISVLAKKIILFFPVVNLLLIYLGTIFVKRSSIKSSANTILKAQSKVKKGMSICLFPEGTRTLDNTVKRFKRGGFRIAISENMIIVPITLYNSKVFGYKNFLFKRDGTLYLYVHSPVDISKLNNDEQERLNIDLQELISKQYEKYKARGINGKKDL